MSEQAMDKLIEAGGAAVDDMTHARHDFFHETIDRDGYARVVIQAALAARDDSGAPLVYLAADLEQVGWQEAHGGMYQHQSLVSTDAVPVFRLRESK